MTGTSSRRRRVVIAGGGVAGLEAALVLRELARDHVDVELVAAEPSFWYRPAAVGEPFGLGEAKHFELAQIVAAAGAAFTPGTLASVDTLRHEAHLSNGTRVEYDALLIACGAVPKVAVRGALTFRGPADTGAMRDLLKELESGAVHRLVFAVPWGATWALPLYELALLTSAHLRASRTHGVELMLATPEAQPFELFGALAAKAMQDLLDEHDITVHTNSYATEATEGELRLFPRGGLAADRVVALPRLAGPAIAGVPQTIDRFIPVDANCQVFDTADVYAAGDITSFDVKQGGIAAQQAHAAAEAIAAWAGADVEPRPFRPVLRGMLLTGGQPRYVRRDLASDEDAGWVSEAPIWWPPAKIVGTKLAPFLAALTGIEEPVAEAWPETGIEVDVELDSIDRGQHGRHPLESAVGAAPGDDSSTVTVGECMSTSPLIVAPEDTLGEVAERMSEQDVGSALVAQFGELIGVLTSRDLLHALAGRVHSSEARVRQWMTAEPVVASADMPVASAVMLMTEYGIHHLPVVDGRRPIGMIGLREAMRATPAVVHTASLSS